MYSLLLCCLAIFNKNKMNFSYFFTLDVCNNCDLSNESKLLGKSKSLIDDICRFIYRLIYRNLNDLSQSLTMSVNIKFAFRFKFLSNL